jgi:hypothetical protein
MCGSIVAGTYGDAVYALRGFEFDAVECAVVLPLCGFVDETVLVAEVRLDDAQVVVYPRLRVVIKKDAAATLRSEFR